ncbi:MAG: hypothetical protein OXE95_01630 [Chloroflexi bacterium]|nr:hypothetical protein [Chloroflexota bacterium]MCY4246261.1 hypothetical protein [Chloroflexota bacterium]
MTLCAIVLPIWSGHSLAQRASATPVPVVLVRATSASDIAPVTVAAAPTIQPIAPELTSARLQALPSAGEVNVRALPDVDSELLGTIINGTAYPVLRNYFRWYEFRYDLSPSGSAWVYGDLVELAGDVSQIAAIDNFAEIQPGDAGEEAEPVADRTIALATTPADNAQGAALFSASPLPTFTPPAATQSAIGDQLRIAASENSLASGAPPILPILALGGLGIVGLLISLLRA